MTPEARWSSSEKAKNGRIGLNCNRILRPNLSNTVKCAIDAIQRIIQIRRMTHPWSA